MLISPEGAHAFYVSTFSGVSTFGQKMLVVPRGGLRQLNKLNDLRKSGTFDLPIGSLCFLPRLSHRRRIRVPQKAVHRRQTLKMLLGLEDALGFYVSIFSGVEHLRADVRKEPGSGH